MMSVIISQFLRVKHSITPNPVFGYFVVSIPLATICATMALLTAIIAALRYFRWQLNMTIGKSISSGWEIITIVLLTFVFLLVIFALHVSITHEIRNED